MMISMIRCKRVLTPTTTTTTIQLKMSTGTKIKRCNKRIINTIYILLMLQHSFVLLHAYNHAEDEYNHAIIPHLWHQLTQYYQELQGC